MTSGSLFVSLRRSSWSRRCVCLGAVLALSFTGQFALGQQTLGSMNGTVTNISGAVMQGANVKARAVATNLEVTAQTKNDGSFSFAVIRAFRTKRNAPSLSLPSRQKHHNRGFRYTKKQCQY